MLKHRRLIFILSLLIAMPAAATTYYRGVTPHAAASRASDQELRVTLVEPSVEPGATPSGRPSHAVTFSYELRNEGTKPINALSFRLACSCQKQGKLPTRLDIGESATVRFRFRVPDFGVSRFSIPVLDGDRVMTVIEAALQSEVTLPHLLIEPGPYTVTAIRGSAAIGSVELITLERREASPWIEGLEIEPAGDLTATFDGMHEASTDPGVARRNYIFRIEASDSPGLATDRRVAARVQFQAGSRAPDEPLVRFPLTVTFKDPIVLVPDRAVFREGAAPGQTSVRIKLIRRDRRALSPATVVSAPDWITTRIESTPGSEAAFETLVVILERTQDAPIAGEVVLAVESTSSRDGELRQLKLPVEWLTEPRR